DGITWTSRTSGVTVPVYGVVWTGSLYIVVSTGGNIYTSPAGITWTRRNTATSSLLLAIARDGDRIIAVGAGGTVQTSAVASLPGVPALTAPAAGATGVVLSPTFTWTAASGASYH